MSNFMAKLSKILVFSFLVLLLFTGQACNFGGGTKKGPAPVTLEYWRISGSPDDLAEVINSFRTKFPHININVRIIEPVEYEKTLLEAWAEDRG